jgi:hypothetical protein
MTKPSHVPEEGQHIGRDRLSWRLHMGAHLWVPTMSLSLLHWHVFPEWRFDLR